MKKTSYRKPAVHPDGPAPVRVGILLLVFLVVAGTIVWRLVNLQVFTHETYAARVREQREAVIEIPSRRGAIYDRRGETLAMSMDTVSLYAVPARVDDPQARAAVIARVLGRDAGDTEARLRQKRSFVWVARKISKRDWEALQALGFKEKTGFGVLTEYRRHYPKDSLASHVLGFVNIDEAGMGGVERTYERHLQGTPLRLVAERYPGGHVALRPQEFYEDSTLGGQVTLTLDHVLQYYVERELDRAMAEHAPRSAAAVVLDPRTGGVLAMASRPAANPNLSRASAPAETWRNVAIEDAWEPGSVMKVFVAAAAMEEGLVSPRDMFDCQQGAITVAGFTMKDHKPFGTLSVSEIIAQSSNVGAIKIGLRFPRREALHRHLKNFGFGGKSGVDLPGESAGILRDPKRWSALSQASLSMGQEMSASALHLSRAMAVIANGGRLVTPHIVLEARDAAGRVVQSAPPPASGKPLFHERTLAQITRMMEEVIENGTGKRAKVPGYTVAGKTGTAQKTDPATGRYAEDRYAALFVGFLPVENPHAVIAVIVDEPSRGKYYGGEVAAPIFGRIAREMMFHMGVPPSFGGQVLTVERSAPAPTAAEPRAKTARKNEAGATLHEGR